MPGLIKLTRAKNFLNHTEMGKRQQLYPEWVPNALLIATTLLLILSVILSVGIYKFATRSVGLNNLSTTERRQLIEQARQIIPAVFQPFPIAGQMLFYHMTPETRHVDVLGATFTSNDLGFRTIPTQPKANGVKRLVVVGDSWTFGQGVRDEEIFTYGLEKMLNRQGVKWQVYNLSMPGWSTANQLAALRTFFFD
jgi:hypothetical protein